MHNIFHISDLFDVDGNPVSCCISGSDGTPEDDAKLAVCIANVRRMQDAENLLAKREKDWNSFYQSLELLSDYEVAEKISESRIYLGKTPNLGDIGLNWAHFVSPFVGALKWLRMQFEERGETIARREFKKLSGLRKAMVIYGHNIKYQNAVVPVIDGGVYSIWLQLKEEMKSKYEFPAEQRNIDPNVWVTRA